MSCHLVIISTTSAMRHGATETRWSGHGQGESAGNELGIMSLCVPTALQKLHQQQEVLTDGTYGVAELPPLNF